MFTLCFSVVQDRFEEALKAADQVDDVIRKASESEIEEIFGKMPLLGLPFTVKENLAVKGQI